jgi:hypothetical protein
VGVKRLVVGQCSSLLKVPHVRLTTEPSLPRRELQISKDPRGRLSGAAHGCKRDNRKLLPRRLLPAGGGCKFASPTLTNVLSGHAGARSPTGAGTTSGLGAHETQGTDQGRARLHHARRPARHLRLGARQPRAPRSRPAMAGAASGPHDAAAPHGSGGAATAADDQPAGKRASRSDQARRGSP